VGGRVAVPAGRPRLLHPTPHRGSSRGCQSGPVPRGGRCASPPLAHPIRGSHQQQHHHLPGPDMRYTCIPTHSPTHTHRGVWCPARSGQAVAVSACPAGTLLLTHIHRPPTSSATSSHTCVKPCIQVSPWSGQQVQPWQPW